MPEPGATPPEDVSPRAGGEPAAATAGSAAPADGAVPNSAGAPGDAAAGDAASEAEPAAAPKNRHVRLIVTIVALVVVFLLVLPVFSTLQPAYYDRYPSLRGRMAAWRQSTHALVPCSGCHVNPGVGGFMTFAARSIPAFYSQLFFGPQTTNLLQVPDRKACQKCHTSYRQVSAGGDLLIPHRAHVEVLKINCAVCHKNLVHSLNAQGFNKPEMSTCLNTCHNGVTATNQCNKCHTQKAMPANHLQKNWLQIHPTMTKTINCGQCHAWAPDYCRQCHLKRPPTHVGNWKTGHAAVAKAEGTKGCLFCHGQAFCKNCH